MTRSMFVLVSAIALTSCAASTPAPETTPPSVAAPAPRGDLSGTSWRLETLAGAPPLEGHAPTLAFGTDGRVSGTAGCNRYFGAYSAESGFGDMGSTRMMCEPARMQQERDYLGILRGASSVMIDSDNLLVVTGSDGRRAVFAAVSTGS